MRRHTTGIALIAIAMLLICPLSHSRVIINHPALGEDLEILVEGEQAPQNASLIAPDGQRITVQFLGNQARYRLQQAGDWEVEVGGQRFPLSVQSRSLYVPPAQSAYAQDSSTLPLYLAAATLLGLVLSLAAIYFLFMRPAKSIPPMLEKKQEGSQVLIRLSAGTLPLSDILLEDAVGKGFKDGPKKMASARLEAGQVMELSYPWGGPLGEVVVRFTMDDLPFELRCTEGIIVLGELYGFGSQADDAPPRAGGAQPYPPTAGQKPPLARARKLGRRND